MLKIKKKEGLREGEEGGSLQFILNTAHSRFHVGHACCCFDRGGDDQDR